ncbi:hypothetical protein [Streptomyces chartreusis]|uniref:hypothetical protein n=1 Tax=Streptomyces chartreusis TaxID=1969 RepID=UPI002F916BF2|nr:hypothetical protein OG938_45280 [Streptomyces chartreusis]
MNDDVLAGRPDVLVAAVGRLRSAEAEVLRARRELSALIVAERKAGVPVAELARKTGQTPVDIRNLLGATGL